MLRDIAPVIRDIFWIACVWNDHNFGARELLDKCASIRKQLTKTEGPRMDVDDANRWLAECEAAMEGKAGD
jgi:hypothetical protein